MAAKLTCKGHVESYLKAAADANERAPGSHPCERVKAKVAEIKAYWKARQARKPKEARDG